MNIVVQGTKEFSDYNIFMRAMGVALSGISDSDNEFNVFTVGPAQINSFTAEFCNRSENSLKARGIKVRYYKVPSQKIESSMDDIDYFAFLSAPNQSKSKLCALAELKDVETGIFRY
jgi:hypothetical protein